MRNNPWQKHQQVYETIQNTKKIMCPYAHAHNLDLVLNNTNGIYSYTGMCWQANKFLNDIRINDIILLYDRQYTYALVLKIASIPINGKIGHV